MAGEGTRIPSGMVGGSEGNFWEGFTATGILSDVSGLFSDKFQSDTSRETARINSAAIQAQTSATTQRTSLALMASVEKNKFLVAGAVAFLAVVALLILKKKV